MEMWRVVISQTKEWCAATDIEFDLKYWDFTIEPTHLKLSKCGLTEDKYHRVLLKTFNELETNPDFLPTYSNLRYLQNIKDVALPTLFEKESILVQLLKIEAVVSLMFNPRNTHQSLRDFLPDSSSDLTKKTKYPVELYRFLRWVSLFMLSLNITET